VCLGTNISYLGGRGWACSLKRRRIDGVRQGGWGCLWRREKKIKACLCHHGWRPGGGPRRGGDFWAGGKLGFFACVDTSWGVGCWECGVRVVRPGSLWADGDDWVVMGAGGSFSNMAGR